MVDHAAAFLLCCSVFAAWHYFSAKHCRYITAPLPPCAGMLFIQQLSSPEQLIMAKKSSEKTTKKQAMAEKRELAMIEGILEGSPDGIGVVVVRLDCGCRKMASLDKNGDPASKIIMYRDMAESICAQCKKDNGAFMRVTESFIHWVEPAPSEKDQEMISIKVLGSASAH